MLNIETLVFPARFYTNPEKRSEFIDYKDAESKGVWFDGVESKIPLDYFIRQHNAINKANRPDKPYQYATLRGSAFLAYPTIEQALEYAMSTGDDTMSGLFSGGGYAGRSIVDCMENAVIPGRKVDSFKIAADIFAIKRNGDLTINDEKVSNAAITRAAIARASSDSKRVKELEEQVAFLTGQLDAVSKAMRSDNVEDVVTHAKVLRQMADALVNIWRGK